jgi:hypothetical protein
MEVKRVKRNKSRMRSAEMEIESRWNSDFRIESILIVNITILALSILNLTSKNTNIKYPIMEEVNII